MSTLIKQINQKYRFTNIQLGKGHLEDHYSVAIKQVSIMDKHQLLTDYQTVIIKWTIIRDKDNLIN